MVVAKKPKPKKCRAAGCDNTFTPFNSITNWCSPACGFALSQEKIAAKKRKEALVVKRDRIATKKAFRDKDRSWWLKATQVDVNKYVRWRDRGNSCITCGKPPEASDRFLKGSGRDAGHYLTRAAYGAIRFDIRQIFAQCVTCNRYKSGKRHEFRLALIGMYGVEFVEWLESQRQPKTWGVDELKGIRATYRKRLRDEQKEAGFAA